MTPLRLPLGSVMVLCLLACGGSGSKPDAGKPTASFDPAPANATRINLGAPLTSERVLLGAVTFANFERHGGGLFLFVAGTEYHQELVSGDFGVINTWQTMTRTFCWAISGASATESSQCTHTTRPDRVAPNDEQAIALLEAVRTFSGSRQPRLAFNGAVVVAGDVDAGTAELLGGLTVSVPAREEFGTWVQGDLERSSNLHYRLSVKNGVVSAPVLLQRSPDEVPLLPGMMFFFDESTPKFVWRNRDDSLFSIDTAERSLSGTYLANGVFGLGIDAPFFPEGAHTGGAATLDDKEYIALLVTPSYETTDDHGDAVGGGPLTNLWLRRAPIEGKGRESLTHFTGLEATTATPTSVDVCFNRLLDPSTVTPANLSVDGLEISSVELLPGSQCVMARTGRQSPDTPYAIHVSGLKSSDGEALTAPQRLTFLSDEDKAVDLLGAFTGLKPTTPGQLLTQLLVLPTGSLVFRPDVSSLYPERDPVFITGADARSVTNLRARYARQGLKLAEPFDTPLHTGVWFAFDRTTPALAFVDGTKEQVFTSAPDAGLLYGTPLALGDGSAITFEQAGLERFTPDGTHAPYMRPDGGAMFRLTGVVMGSSDALVVSSAGMAVERRKADATLVATYSFAGRSFIPSDLMVFDLTGETMLCAPGLGFFRIAADGSLAQVGDACESASVGPDGAVWVRGTGMHSASFKEKRYANGQLTGHVLTDPVYGAAVGGWLDRPVRIGDTVFAWTHSTMNGPGYPSTLRMMRSSAFDRLVPEAP